MRIECEKAVLVEALNIVTKAVPTRSTLQILEGIRLEAKDGRLVLTASDLEISIQKTIEATVEEEGIVIVMAKLFNDIIRKMPDETIAIYNTDPQQVVIKSGKSKFKVVAFADADEFPMLQLDEDTKDKLYFESDIFRSMVKQTSFAASVDNAKGILTGILTEINEENIRMVAIDGFRLALVNQKMAGREKCKFVISAKIMEELCKIIVAESQASDMYISLGVKKAHIEVGGTVIVLRIMEGSFINYDAIIPKTGTTHVTVNKDILYACLERASLFATEGKNNLIKMDISNNTITIASRSEAGNVTEQVPVAMSGEKLTIGFNSKFVMDVLKAIDDDEVVMQFNEPTAPCVIRSHEDNKYEYLVLPVRLS